MSFWKKEKGNTGERLAADFLRKAGYQILESNWQSRLGEIDLIAQDKQKVIAFVEVKARGRVEDSWEAVDHHKQRRMHRLALFYLQTRKYPLETAIRFDAIAVTPKGVFHEPNAFIPESEI